MESYALRLRKSKAEPIGSAFVEKLYLELDLEVKTFLHARSTDFDTRTIRNACPLEIWVLAAVTSWVEFGSTNRVGILSNNF